MKDFLVSVVVPIYNVAPWLRQCLDSLKQQTMTQIEVLLIDDGSTDESGVIAQEYCKSLAEGPWFRCIHTENRGLSAARNLGIREARSEWLMFVDSDDWVDEHFCEIPYRTAISKNADVVIFDAYDITKRGSIIHDDNKEVGYIDQEKAIDVGGIVVWNKLYRKDLFHGICFPDGKVYEDKAVTPIIIYKAEHIYNVGVPLYYHRFRAGSITQTASIENIKDLFEMYLFQYRKLTGYGYPKDKLEEGLWKIALSFYGRTESEMDLFYREAEKVLEEIDGIPKGFSMKEKAKIIIWRTDRKAYRQIYKLIIMIKKGLYY